MPTILKNHSRNPRVGSLKTTPIEPIERDPKQDSSMFDEIFE